MSRSPRRWPSPARFCCRSLARALRSAERRCRASRLRLRLWSRFCLRSADRRRRASRLRLRLRLRLCLRSSRRVLLRARARSIFPRNERPLASFALFFPRLRGLRDRDRRLSRKRASFPLTPPPARLRLRICASLAFRPPLLFGRRRLARRFARKRLANPSMVSGADS